MNEEYHEIMDYAMKIKKVVRKNGKTYQGIVVPMWNSRGHFFSTSDFLLYTVSGEVEEFYTGFVKIENTRITDKKVKAKLEKLQEVLKKEFQIQKETLAIEQEYKKKLAAQQEKMDNKLSKLYPKEKDCRAKLAKVQGLITPKDFLELLKAEVKNNSDYSIEVDFSSGKVNEVVFRKDVRLGKYLSEEDFGFLYVEYDGTLMTYEDLDQFNDFKALKAKHFHSVGKLKVKGNPVTEFFGVDAGDKRTADIYHKVTISFGDKYKIAKENVKKVAACIHEVADKL